MTFGDPCVGGQSCCSSGAEVIGLLILSSDDIYNAVATRRAEGQYFILGFAPTLRSSGHRLVERGADKLPIFLNTAEARDLNYNSRLAEHNLGAPTDHRIA